LESTNNTRTHTRWCKLIFHFEHRIFTIRLAASAQRWERRADAATSLTLA